LAQQHRINPKNTLALLASLNDHGDRNEELASMLHAAGTLWCNGVPVRWEQLQPNKQASTVRGRKVRIPGYPFQRKLLWIEPKSLIDSEPIQQLSKISNPSPSKSISIPVATSSLTMNTQTATTIDRRKKQIESIVCEVIENTSGVEIDDTLTDSTFMELGVNSLMLTQTASALQREFVVPVSFRQLLEETPTTGTLVEWLCGRLPAERFVEPAVAEIPAEPIAEPLAEPVQVSSPQPPRVIGPPIAAQNGTLNNVIPFANIPSNDALIQIVQQQMQLMQMHMQLLINAATQQQGENKAVSQNVVPVVTNTPLVNSQDLAKKPLATALTAPILQANESTGRVEASKTPEVKKVFGAQARVSLQPQ